jgi:hypothetical protein
MKPAYKFFRGVFFSWDNTPRRQHSSAIFINSSPELYKLFLKATLALTRAEHSEDEQLVFINAWNEWAEGAHLEPDQKYGMSWLEATKEAANELIGLQDALKGLNDKCSDMAFKITELNLPQVKSFEQPHPSLSSCNDVILNSYTFKVGRIIMWFPIRIYNFLLRLKVFRHE